jgi:hypothetical protein
MLVRVNLLDPWQPLGTTTRSGERISTYLYGFGDDGCFLVCRNGLRRERVMRQIVEAELEVDTGGIVVTLLRMGTASRAPTLTRVLAEYRRSSTANGRTP